MDNVFFLFFLSTHYFFSHSQLSLCNAGFNINRSCISACRHHSSCKTYQLRFHWVILRGYEPQFNRNKSFVRHLWLWSVTCSVNQMPSLVTSVMAPKPFCWETTAGQSLDSWLNEVMLTLWLIRALQSYKQIRWFQRFQQNQWIHPYPSEDERYVCRAYASRLLIRITQPLKVTQCQDNTWQTRVLNVEVHKWWSFSIIPKTMAFNSAKQPLIS